MAIGQGDSLMLLLPSSLVRSLQLIAPALTLYNVCNSVDLGRIIPICLLSSFSLIIFYNHSATPPGVTEENSIKTRRRLKAYNFQLPGAEGGGGGELGAPNEEDVAIQRAIQVRLNGAACLPCLTRFPPLFRPPVRTLTTLHRT